MWLTRFWPNALKADCLETWRVLWVNIKVNIRPARGTTDQLFLLREIQAESYEFKKETFALFIDFKQAYDQLNSKEMLQSAK